MISTQFADFAGSLVLYQHPNRLPVSLETDGMEMSRSRVPGALMSTAFECMSYPREQRPLKPNDKRLHKPNDRRMLKPNLILPAALAANVEPRARQSRTPNRGMEKRRLSPVGYGIWKLNHISTGGIRTWRCGHSGMNNTKLSSTGLARNGGGFKHMFLGYQLDSRRLYKSPVECTVASCSDSV